MNLIMLGYILDDRVEETMFGRLPLHPNPLKIDIYTSPFPVCIFSLEMWYNTILVLLTGNMKNAQIALDALSIW